MVVAHQKMGLTICKTEYNEKGFASDCIIHL